MKFKRISSLRRPYWLLALLPLTGFVGGGCGGGSQPAADTVVNPTALDVKTVTGIGRVEPEVKIHILTAEVSGIVAAVRKESGSQAKADDPIIELAHELQDNVVLQRKLALQNRLAAHQTIVVNIEAAKIRAQNALVNYNRIKALYESGVDTKTNHDNALTDYETRQKEVEQLQTQLATSLVGIEEAKALLSNAEIEVEKRYIRAPADGTVLTMDLTNGAPVQALAKVGEFAPAGYLSVLVEIDELFAEKVKVGQPATIRAQGSTDVLATGKVVYVAPFLKKKSLFSDTGNDLEDRRVREVRVRIESGKELLISARVEVSIDVSGTGGQAAIPPPAAKADTAKKP